MAWMMFLLGFIALMPGYVVSVEERLLAEKRFHPFSVFTNLRRSVKARKFLSFFGLSLLGGVCLLYLFYDYPMAGFFKTMQTFQDWVKFFGAVFIVWLFFFYGYAREEELVRNSVDSIKNYSWMKGLKGRALLKVFVKACAALLFMLVCIAGLAGIKFLIERF
ncbi:hypothetical protein K5D34_06365 [Pseudomonas cichorii]|uniref:hypothetical protein n=1 Tax=Pseudomonas cichorii TaxID=36746 RepID=UPI0018E5E215|nr:hypothetical protein [Pseudomonas cichorii]MBI6854473.1 hypothetical protein [Pseudomonas cichorii]MBX8489551.1 hypothetical protein [Pseudomonas cichorii]MBX8509315.1 hypothetical protein [Pseudomonas cichorii]MBX8524174.1 hypothetical protein [Pseudomonas cichorii]MBX8541540.1 hypothetical protein [Pseudomonas cichorii]